MKRTLTVLGMTILICVVLPGSASSQQAIVLKGGKLLTVSHGTIENGVLVIENGKITAVGSVAEVKIPANARVQDVSGMTVYPGLIDSESYLGLTEISAEQMTNDLIELSDEIMPHMHVYDAFHAESELIPVARLNGITNAIVAPESKDTLPGQDSFIQLDGKSSQEMLLVRDVAMPLNFTGEQRRNESWEKRKFPSTRMGLAAQLRQAFLDAQHYAQDWADYEKKKSEKADDKEKKGPPSPPKHDLKLDALLPYLQGKKTISSGQEDDCFGSPGTERPGGSSEPGSRIQSKIRAQSHQPLATGARLCGQPEGTSNRRPDLRNSQAAGTLRRGLQPASAVVQTRGEDCVCVIRRP